MAENAQASAAAELLMILEALRAEIASCITLSVWASPTRTLRNWLADVDHAIDRAREAGGRS